MNFPMSHDSRDSIPPPAWDYRASQDSIPLPLMDRGSPIPDPAWPISRDSIPSPTLLSPLPTSQVEENDGINHDLTFYKNSLLQSKISSSSMIHVPDKNLSQKQINSNGSDILNNIINDGSYYDNNNYYNGINYDDVKDEEYEEILSKNISREENDVLENQRINDENDKESCNSNDDSSNSSSKSRDSSSQDNNFGDNIVMNLSSSTSSTSASSFSIYGSLLRKF